VGTTLVLSPAVDGTGAYLAIILAPSVAARGAVEQDLP
jgi:hypothetical protein